MFYGGCAPWAWCFLWRVCAQDLKTSIFTVGARANFTNDPKVTLGVTQVGGTRFLQGLAILLVFYKVFDDLAGRGSTRRGIGGGNLNPVQDLTLQPKGLRILLSFCHRFGIVLGTLGDNFRIVLELFWDQFGIVLDRFRRLGGAGGLGEGQVNIL